MLVLRRHEMHMRHFKPEAGDPAYEAAEGGLICQFGAKGCRARASGEFAVVEIPRSVVHAWPVKVISYACGRTQKTPRGLLVQRAASVPEG